MEKFLDLCVDLKKSQLAKDGLHQYKTISQTVSVKSLEDVIMRFLQQGEERCSNARKEATNALVDIDDLEVLQTPERYLKTFIFILGMHRARVQTGNPGLGHSRVR
jgi:translation initiation factor 3 subunit A